MRLLRSVMVPFLKLSVLFSKELFCEYVKPAAMNLHHTFFGTKHIGDNSLQLRGRSLPVTYFVERCYNVQKLG